MQLMRYLEGFHRTLSALRNPVAGRAAPTKHCGPVAVATEALESRILFALAALTGGLSANLSSNPTIRKQQLLCDPATPSSATPAAPLGGAISVSYDPTKVTLVDVEPAAGYTIDDNASHILVTSEGTFPEHLGQFLSEVSDGPLPEAGKVDIYFSLGGTGSPGQTPVASGYSEMQEAGPIGYDDCILTFQLLSGVSNDAPKYTVFADPNAISGTPDFLTAADGHTITAANITPATVGGTMPQGLSTVPDPANPALNDVIINDNSAAGNDTVQIDPVGRSKTGSTGITVKATLNGVHYSQTFNQAVPSVCVYLKDGNDNVLFNPSLTLYGCVTAGKGNDNVLLGGGANMVSLGSGNDNVLSVGGASMVTAGDGNDNVLLAGGSNSVTLGNGNDNVLAAGGSNTVVAGNGNDNVLLGDGSNESVTLGNGNDNVFLGNGSNDNVYVGSGNDLVQIGDGNGNTVHYSGSHPPKVKFGRGTNNSISSH